MKFEEYSMVDRDPSNSSNSIVVEKQKLMKMIIFIVLTQMKNELFQLEKTAKAVKRKRPMI